MKKYQVGIEFDPSGEVRSTRGLVNGRAINNIRKLIKLNKKNNTYVHVWFDSKETIVEIWKLNKAEYQKLNCGFGLTDFGDFIKDLL